MNPDLNSVIVVKLWLVELFSIVLSCSQNIKSTKVKVRVYYFHGKSQKFQASNNIVYCCVTSSGGFSLADFNNNCHLKKMEKPQQSDNSRNNNNSLYDQALGHSEKDELFF